ncbi:MAG: hypothetical protein ACLR8Y_15690 [Alistipes indistinctus]
MTERPTPLGPGVQRTYSWTTAQGYRLEYRITRIGNDAFTLSAALTNGSLNPIRLERFWLLKTPENGMTVTGKPSDWMLSSTDPEARRWGTLDRRLPTERELLQEGAFCRNYLISGGDETKINDPAWRGFGDNMSLYHRSGRGNVRRRRYRRGRQLRYPGGGYADAARHPVRHDRSPRGIGRDATFRRSTRGNTAVGRGYAGP